MKKLLISFVTLFSFNAFAFAHEYSAFALDDWWWLLIL
ncbi:hypothetical protein [uncultured Gammaproteobacteria bacterium]|jgi:hypothetical protein|nr:hypothetical protein [uncultured Gammaproteobacteria bacterium]SSC10608.1 hypothetical protein BPUTEOSOX_957 [thiotrophic endosymbiont of Bathymodiolus puteoserpentis (Logatchev)]CAC9572585.1 hypothetical protein [uncultured Gammaproteobacteria bacterium]CAC9575628.1 hypothetical protein [uncultured Gammaproteobacteria bacterium]CAC9628939.1 hypothetical protein [uncultured Gammaproteobacteria bacterium]